MYHGSIPPGVDMGHCNSIAMPARPEVAHPPMVREAIEALQKEHEALGVRIAELEARVDPVARPDEPRAAGGDRPPRPPASPVAHAIYHLADEARDANARLARIVARLDV